MRMHALAISALIVAGCGGKSPTTVTPSSTPPAPGDGGAASPTPAPPPGDMGGGGGGGAGGGGAGGGGGGGAGGGGGGGGGGTACTDDKPVAIATAEMQASALAVDDSDVYFVTQGGQFGPWNFWRAPIGGGAAVERGTFDHDSASYVTVNATAVFTLSGDGLLQRWAKSGGAPLTMRTGNQYVIATCLADAYGFIYDCNDEGRGYVQVRRQPEDGGGATEVVAADYGITNLAFDSAHVWFTTTHGVFGAPPDGKSGTSISIASNGAIGPIAVDEAHVYVASQQQIYSADKRDGAALAPIATSPSYANQLVTDGGNLYVRGSVIDSAGYTHGTITRYAADGSGAARLAQANGLAGGMAVRGPYVYFTDAKDSTVYRVCK